MEELLQGYRVLQGHRVMTEAYDISKYIGMGTVSNQNHK